MRTNVLLDTSFLIRFLNTADPLHQNAKSFFSYFKDQDSDFILSTIAIAEYCVKGNLSELPIESMKLLPFNIDHAKKASDFSKIVMPDRGGIERKIVINDIKLMAQAECHKTVGYYASADAKSLKIFSKINEQSKLNFEFIDINGSVQSTFGVLLPE